MKKLILISLFTMGYFNVGAQNTYAEVTGVAGNTVTLATGNSGTFVVGNQAMIMQMKGASVEEINNADYGSITNFNSAGTYAFGTVLVASATSVTLSIGVDAYDVNSNVQLISIPPDDGAGNYVEDGTNEPPLWDGYTGGVYAVNICGTYTLNGDLTSKGGGFRGGLTNPGNSNYYTPLVEQWVASDPQDFEFSAFKGEGIASTYCQTGDFLGPGVQIDPVFAYSSGGWAYWYTLLADPNPWSTDYGILCSVHDIGSGALANGGGSGLQANGGGGGGSNGGAGGNGGCGWYINYDCTNGGIGMCGKACNATGAMDSTDSQGIGGYAIASTTGSSLFLGGGGGAGITFSSTISIQPSNNQSTLIYFGSQGVSGGVIYIINAELVEGNGFTISANGDDQLDIAEWEANGGGGAGGSIYIGAPVANNLNLSAKGGKGGSVYFDNYGCYHENGEIGPGGGGGGGVILASGSGLKDVSGGLAGLYWDKNGKYPGKTNGINYCAENGADGIVTTALPSTTCAISIDNNVSCLGGDGALEVKIYLPLCSSGGEPMSVDWSTGNSQSGLLIGDSVLEGDLSPGAYTVTVTDNNSETGTCTAILAPPSLLTTSSSSTPEFSPGADDGTATATPSGGTGGYTYLWSGGQTGNLITNLATATYCCTVTDANSCTTSTCVFVDLGTSINELSRGNVISVRNNTITIKGIGTATIYNLQGQRVHQSKLTGKTSISLGKGIYLVKVRSEGRSVTKKVYLN
ncbi:MAG: T9SS type A sorting domain-containing protein [Bacteroidetes bacterium]|nr:T9SS type A sorting domain-containing protein [Bacteroidota bacterium]